MKKKPLIAVVDPAVYRPETQSFNAMVTRNDQPLTYHLPASVGMGSLENLPLRAVIVLGSACSVYEGLPWQAAFHDWLKIQIENSVPVLGICYGHQLIAHLYGAKVEFMSAEKTKQEGFRKIDLTAGTLWGNKPAQGNLAVSHREIVVDCPKGFKICGSSPLVPVEALVHDTRPVWTFQAHPEVTGDFLQRLSPDLTIPQDPFSFGHSIVDEFIRAYSN